MPHDLSRFTLNLETDLDTDEQGRIDLIRRLRKELLQLREVESVESPSITTVPGSKAAGVDWQTLLVTVAASGGLLTTLLGTVQTWLTRHERVSVTLEIGGDKLAITGASDKVPRRLIKEWIDRRSASHMLIKPKSE
jgi:hypothetical protein